MQHVYCALLAALTFPVITWLDNTLAFEYLASHPVFVLSCAAGLGVNAVLGYLAGPWVLDRVEVDPFGDPILDEAIGIFVTAVLAGILFWVECYAGALVLCRASDTWLLVAGSHYGAFRNSVYIATVFADVVSGPLLFTHLYRVLRSH